MSYCFSMCASECVWELCSCKSTICDHVNYSKCYIYIYVSKEIKWYIMSGIHGMTLWLCVCV